MKCLLINRRSFVIATAALVSLQSAGLRVEGAVTDSDETLSAALPSPVYRLSLWTNTPPLLVETNRIKDEDPRVAYPKSNCGEWISKVVDKDWMPPGHVPAVFIQDEFDGRDVVRSAWKSGSGYELKVAQTASLFVLQVVPPLASTGPVDEGLDKDKVRGILLDLLRKDGERRTPDGTVVAISKMNEKIVRFSVDEARITPLGSSGAMLASPQGPEEAGVGRPESDIAEVVATSPTNSSWEATFDSYGYWLRRVHWWTDGKSIRVYFFKIEGGAWVPSYVGEIDRNWFRGPRDRSGHQLRK